MGQSASKQSEITLSNDNNNQQKISLQPPQPKPYSVDINNWLQYTKGKIDGNLKGELLLTSQGSMGDPAQGCSKNFNASYKCFPNSDIKTISIPESADGKTAIFSCEDEYNRCTSFHRAGYTLHTYPFQGIRREHYLLPASHQLRHQ